MMAKKLNTDSVKRYCLITGAAGGLGLELAKLFAKKGYSLVLIDKDKENLTKAMQLLKSKSDIEIVSMHEDLSNDQAALKIYESIKKLPIEIEVLINNAGFGYFGFFAENNWDKQQDMIKLSVLTTTHLSKLFLTDMIANKKGHILNIASLAAFQPGPLMSVYHASKSFMLSFSQSLANELKGTGVYVTVVCPGVIATGFQKANNNESPKLKWTIGSAEKVAAFCYRSIIKKKVVAIPGLMNWIAANMTRFMPRNTTTRIVRKIQERNRQDLNPIHP